MAVSNIVRAASSPEARSHLVTLLKPMDNGPQEIRALDGLRAVAALSIVVFHTMLFLQLEYQPWSQAINHGWYYLSTGVHLFFVLSGFLLFLPYVRAMLDGERLPSARRFYRRRALRILPAYWVCLGIMVGLKVFVRQTPLSLGDVAAHLVLIHDSFPEFNRDYNGPFWTMAVEAQFYLLMPLMALLVARVSGGRRSPWRIAGGITLLIGLALIVRLAGAVVMGTLSPADAIADSPTGIVLLATMGMQGKYLEVFAVGMFCALLYVVTVERRMLSATQLRRVGLLALGIAGVCIALAIPQVDLAGLMVAPGVRWGLDAVGYPLLVGVGYGGLMLAILWGGQWIRLPFEFAPMRMIGLVSYSLYLWHLPIIHADVPVFAGVPLAVVLVSVFLVSYLSYQLVERPFLRRRSRQAAPKPAGAPDSSIEAVRVVERAERAPASA